MTLATYLFYVAARLCNRICAGLFTMKGGLPPSTRRSA
jgi:hypothetical protein